VPLLVFTPLGGITAILELASTYFASVNSKVYVDPVEYVTGDVTPTLDFNAANVATGAAKELVKEPLSTRNLFPIMTL